MKHWTRKDANGVAQINAGNCEAVAYMGVMQRLAAYWRYHMKRTFARLVALSLTFGIICAPNVASSARVYECPNGIHMVEPEVLANYIFAAPGSDVDYVEADDTELLCECIRAILFQDNVQTAIFGTFTGFPVFPCDPRTSMGYN